MKITTTDIDFNEYDPTLKPDENLARGAFAIAKGLDAIADALDVLGMNRRNSRGGVPGTTEALAIEAKDFVMAFQDGRDALIAQLERLNDNLEGGDS